MNPAKFAKGVGFNNEELKPFAESPEGVAFLEKHLHPPGYTPGVEGVPDRDGMASVVVDYKDAFTVSKPATGTGNWNCLLLSAPNLQASSYYWTWRDGDTSMGTAQVHKIPAVLAGTLNVTPNISRIRPIARSTTAYLNAPALADQGMVYGVQWKPNISADIKEVSTSVYLPVADLFANKLPADGDAIVGMSSKAYMGKAREGCYISHSYTQPTVSYKDTSTRTVALASSQVAYTVHLHYQDGISDAATEFVPFSQEGGYQYDDMSAGWILFKGLSDTASVEFKVFYMIEACVPQASSWAPFVTDGAIPDGRAMDNAYKIRHYMQDAYPSANNFLGALGSVLSKIGQWLLPSVAHAAQAGLGSVAQRLAPTPAPRAIQPTPAPRPAPRQQAPVPAPRKSKKKKNKQQQQ
jgi:hypothetical protein